MSSPKPLETVVTFKADSALLEALKKLPNRSEFIRAAILAALDNHCPLCAGTGVLTPHQKTHWEVFARQHPLRECVDCHEVHLICAQEEAARDAAESPGEHGDTT